MSNVPVDSSGKTFHLPDELVQTVQNVAAAEGVSEDEALRRLIVDGAFVHQQMNRGCKVLLQDPSKKTKEVIFR